MRGTRSIALALILASAAIATSTAPAGAQVNATLVTDTTRLQGTHSGGSLLLYSPDPVQQGSSISHWDTSATPNLLMEPFATGDLPFLSLDITPGQMQDVFWALGSLNINIFDLDAPGTGFTDSTPFAGAPGNPATTLGEARLNLFVAVLGAWANSLGSNVDVDVLVSWQDLTCLPGVGATLGSASTLFVVTLTGGGLPGPTLFHAALAESIISPPTDLTGPPASGGGDVIVFMNAALDNECLGTGTGWYYGLDGNVPPGLFDAAGTVLHEFGHGVGFSNFINETTGVQTAGTPGIYDLWTFDNTTGKFWDQMSDAERVQSATNFRQVTWEGPVANAQAATALATGVPELVVNSPAPIAGTYIADQAVFGPALPGTPGLTANLACLRDSSADGSDFNGCTPATNPGEIGGKIALINRGSCAFVDKVANAQAAGATGVIVANNVGDSTFAMGGSDPSITIPSVMIGQTDGMAIRDQTCPCPATQNVTGTVSGDQTLRARTSMDLGSLAVVGTTIVRFLSELVEVGNNVTFAGTVAIESTANACTAP